MQRENTASFHEIYNRYWKRMFAIAFIRLKRRELAEDVVQEVFAMLWLKAAAHEINNLEAWLATAVKYKVITLARRELRITLQYDLPEIPVHNHQSEYHFLQDAMKKVISCLPERCQLIFQYHQQNLSNSEISKRLEISEKAVEKQLTKARHSLRVAFRQILSLFFF